MPSSRFILNSFLYIPFNIIIPGPKLSYLILLTTVVHPNLRPSSVCVMWMIKFLQFSYNT